MAQADFKSDGVPVSQVALTQLNALEKLDWLHATPRVGQGDAQRKALAKHREACKNHSRALNLNYLQRLGIGLLETSEAKPRVVGCFLVQPTFCCVGWNDSETGHQQFEGNGKIMAQLGFNRPHPQMI